MRPTSREDRQKLKNLRRLEQLRRNHSLFFYEPYPKQKEFHALGATKRERLLCAANKIGKTYSAGFEIAFHTTGIYPAWWEGRCFEKATRGWVGSVNAGMARDGAQRVLLGAIGRWGSGCIPKDRILDVKRARGVPDAVESVLVNHISGIPSHLVFKSYEEGREAWQAEDLDWVWCDEEPPLEIYSEGLTRTNNSGGFMMMTFTPLLGMSDVVMRFMNEHHEDRAMVNMTIDDALHYTDEQRRKIIESYLPHERDARAMGTPMLGSGRIFPVSEELILEEPMPEIPLHWKQIIGLDFGWDHPTAAARLAYEPENDCIHVVSAYRQKEATPIIHAAAIRPWGEWIPVAWPKDGLEHDKGSGDQIADIYRKQGLKMVHEHAQFADDRGNGVEAGITEMLQRMQTGRFKVARTLQPWLEEFRMFHRKDGKVVKLHDDLMAATRYAVMMLRYAVPREHHEPVSQKYSTKRYHETTWMSA